MARSQCPSTPFSTPLSGSARQAEARIRNLFQGPKRRPPVWLMVLALLLILSCGGLVACQSQEAPPLEGDCVQTGEHDAPSARLIQAVLDQGLSALDLTSPPVSQVLATLPGNGCTLAAVSLSDGSSHYILAIGVVQESDGAVGPVFLVQGQGSPVHRQQPFPVALSGRIRSSRFRRHSVHLGLAGGGRRPGGGLRRPGGL